SVRWRPPTQRLAGESRNFPCQFPLSREFSGGDRFVRTASTTNHSRVLARFGSSVEVLDISARRFEEATGPADGRPRHATAIARQFIVVALSLEFACCIPGVGA